MGVELTDMETTTAITPTPPKSKKQKLTENPTTTSASNSPDHSSSTTTTLYFSQNKIRNAMKSSLTTTKTQPNTLISEAAVHTLNMACSEFIIKLLRESAITTATEAAQNNQTELPIN